jgi:outer membrane immunogenic protein
MCFPARQGVHIGGGQGSAADSPIAIFSASRKMPEKCIQLREFLESFPVINGVFVPAGGQYAGAGKREGKAMTPLSMKGLGVFLGFLVAAASTGAEAADTGPAKDYAYAAADIPARWGGAYAGAGVLGVIGVAKVLNGASGPEFSLPGSAALGGQVSLGYNWQSGSWVMGVEGNLGYNKNETSGTGPVVGAVRVAETDYGSIQVRGGYAFNRLLVYVTTGLAINNRGVDWNLGRFEGVGASLLLGAGLEYAFDERWSVRPELKFSGVQDKGLEFAGGSRDVQQGTGVISLGVARKF